MPFISSLTFLQFLFRSHVASFVTCDVMNTTNISNKEKEMALLHDNDPLQKFAIDFKAIKRLQRLWVIIFQLIKMDPQTIFKMCLNIPFYLPCFTLSSKSQQLPKFDSYHKTITISIHVGCFYYTTEPSAPYLSHGIDRPFASDN